MKKIYVFTVLLFMLSACSKNVPQAQMTEALIQGSVQAGAAYAAATQPATVPAMLVVTSLIVTDINSGEIVTLANINAAISAAAVQFKISPATQTAITTFMAAMQPVMQTQMQASGVSDLNGAQVYLCAFAQWVNNTVGGNAKCTVPIVLSAPTHT